MFGVVYFLLLLSTALVNCKRISLIQNVTLIPRYQWNSTQINNHTYQQCLCMSTLSFIGLNWFPNNTCQLFYSFSVTYEI
jgi:hypothetical protein